MTRTIIMIAAMALSAAALSKAQTWVMQQSGTEAGLRGIGALNANVVWASGTNGTYLTTTDGGAHWRVAQVPGAEQLDFRDLHVADATTVYLLSIGAGDQSRVYKTIDSGTNWKLMFTNPDPKGFFDSIAFWDARNGIIIGDAVEGRAGVFTTDDAGEHWIKREPPPAIANEGSFAASGTAVFVQDTASAWFVTGGIGAARVFHSGNGGRTWDVVPTPIRNDSASAGIFSVAFSDRRRGIIVGGDYSRPAEAAGNIAVTIDSGRTWHRPQSAPGGFRSAVVYVPSRKIWIATGASGSDISHDDGATWKTFDTGAFNSVTFSGGSGWAVGPRGRVAVFRAE